MMVVLLIAGIGCLLAGLLAIGFGIPVQEFSFGNTLILAGAVTACTGLVILALWAVVRELKAVAQGLGAGIPPGSTGAALQPMALPAAPTPEDGGFSLGHDQTESENASSDGQLSASQSAPWHEEAASRDRARVEPPVPPYSPALETPAAAKPKRNLMFSSTSRRERERAQARAADSSADDPGSGLTVPSMLGESSETPATFDDAWPKSERSPAVDLPPRRSGRPPSTLNETTPTPAGTDRYPPTREDQPPVTVLKSGVVDGMAYSLYSDGSIEAQMPEGMMRFASIDELRSHLDQRP
jgi:hypothetical protein